MYVQNVAAPRKPGRPLPVPCWYDSPTKRVANTNARSRDPWWRDSPLVLNSRRLVRKELEGRPHVVVPVVMIAGEMVMNGSNGPTFYPARETDPTAGLWNGRPVVLQHPQLMGKSFAGHPTVFSESRIGVIFNSRSNRGQLRADVWLDEGRTKAIAPTVLTKLHHGEPVEVSTGLYGDRIEKPGVHNNVRYDGTLTNYKPDHLAVLPDHPGACSVADGCGLSAN